jgi:hypothetical protein
VGFCLRWTPPLARAAGLTDNPGFDILSNRPAFGATSAKSPVFEERAIEVKGRAGLGDIELTETNGAAPAICADVIGSIWLRLRFAKPAPAASSKSVHEAYRECQGWRDYR